MKLACYLGAGALLVGAGGYLIFGQDKGLGIFLVLVAVILTRVLVVNIAERHVDP